MSVLRDYHARARRDEGGCRRDVEGAGSVAAGAYDVNRVEVADIDLHTGVAHGPCSPGKLGGRHLVLRKRRKERGKLYLAHFAGENRREEALALAL